MPLNQRSMRNLEGVHEDLVRVVLKAAEKIPFLVTEGVRDRERQAQLVKTGKSQTKNSRHLYGMAVDVCDMDGCYDEPDMKVIARSMKAAAAELEIPIQWGGDWKTFKDTPHFELERKAYPDSGALKPWHALKPGDTGKIIGGLGAAGATGKAANDMGLMPTFEQVTGVVLQAGGQFRVAFVALAVGFATYFVAPRIARKVLGWEI